MCKVVNSLIMNVVSDGKEVPGGGSPGGKISREIVLGNLNLIRIVMKIVFGVQIKVYDMIAQGCHVGSAGCGAAGIRWSHVCRKESENVVESHLSEAHLIHSLSFSDGREILMAPSMRSKLMTSRVHAAKNCRPSKTSIVNHALSVIIAGNEEGCFGTVRSKEIQ